MTEGTFGSFGGSAASETMDEQDRLLAAMRGLIHIKPARSSARAWTAAAEAMLVRMAETLASPGAR